MSKEEISFDHFYTNLLNETQRKIVDHTTGIMVVHAGAGSGKTRVITAKIASLLLKKNVASNSLIALTFTNKAANEMKERVTKFLNSSQDYINNSQDFPEFSLDYLSNYLYKIPLPFIGTFHSYCLRLLRQNLHLLDLPDFNIIDEDDQEKLIKKIIETYSAQKRVNAKQMLSFISRMKNDSVDGIIKYDKIQDFCLRDIFLAYEKEKTVAKNIDFDDLLLKTLYLFKHHQEFKLNHQRRIRHILVDEFQDTNHVQHALLKEMISVDNKFLIDSLCIVGDEDQSIYSWRGAIPGKMISFKEDFSGTHTFTLEQNYRSIQPILNIANNLIKNNKHRKAKNLRAINNNFSFGNNRILLLNCVSGYQEAELLAMLAQEIVLSKKSLKDFAVLYRSHYQSRALEEALIRHSVPYIIIGGVRFYDRQEIKDLLAYLKLMVNPFDRIAFSRVINTPSRGLGDKFQEMFFDMWEKNSLLNFIQIADLIIEQKLISPSKIGALKTFINIFKDESVKDSEDLTTKIFEEKPENILTKKLENQTKFTESLDLKSLENLTKAESLDTKNLEDTINFNGDLDSKNLENISTKNFEKKESGPSRNILENLPTKILEDIIEKTKYFDYLEKSYDPSEAKERSSNVKELVYAIASKEEFGLKSLRDFLEEVVLLQEKGDMKNEADYISLMTLHGAKGLEFGTIMIAGLEEGILPSGHSIISNETIEEERRLLYVGITRAKERLVITHANYRYSFGQMNEQLPSRFIQEFLNEQDVSRIDISEWQQYQMSLHFRKWLNPNSSIENEEENSFAKELRAMKKNFEPEFFDTDPFESEVSEKDSLKSESFTKEISKKISSKLKSFNLEEDEFIQSIKTKKKSSSSKKSFDFEKERVVKKVQDIVEKKKILTENSINKINLDKSLSSKKLENNINKVILSNPVSNKNFEDSSNKPNLDNKSISNKSFANVIKKNFALDFPQKNNLKDKKRIIDEKKSSSDKENLILNENLLSKKIWRINQTVHHNYFGSGVIEEIEKKRMDQIYLSIRFKNGLKKIDSRFVKEKE